MHRVIEDDSNFETWRNSTRGRIVLKRLDRTGALVDEMIGGGKTFHITPGERRLNQEMVASEDMDAFQNGFLTPVRLIETSEDTAVLKANPNLITESDMAELFKQRAVAKFSESISGVSNSIVLERMLEIANSDEVNASVKQVEALKQRLAAIQGPDAVSEAQMVESTEGRSGIATFAPDRERARS